MRSHIITINPDRIDNANNLLPFDINLFSCDAEPEDVSLTRVLTASKSRVRQLVTITASGKPPQRGYVHTLNYALEMVRVDFSREMNRLWKEGDLTDFQVKYECSSEKDDEPGAVHTCKLYHLQRGNIWNSRTKLVTFEIVAIPRLELQN